MSYDDDLLEGLDDFDDESFPGDDYDEFPDEMDEMDEGGGPSPVFLIAGGLIVATFLVLLVIVILLLSSGGDDTDQQAATDIAATNQAVELIFQATSTRQAVVDLTQTATTEFFFEQGTRQAADAATAEAAQVESQLDATRTALAQEATATEEAIISSIRSTADAETATVIALTPTDTPTPIPPTLEIQVRDADGNPIPGGMLIYVYLDDGDGVFNPIPNEPTPTPRVTLTPTPPPVTPTNTAMVIPTLTPSETPTPRAVTQTPVGEGSDDVQGAGANLDAADTLFLVVQLSDSGNSGPFQEGETPSPSPTVVPVGDRQVATIYSNPDGSFTLEGLPPGSYWLVIDGQPINITVPDTPTQFEIPTEGTPISILVIPNLSFPTITPTPSVTPLPTDTPDPALVAITETAAAQETAVASIMPTFQTLEPTLDPAVASVVAGTLTAEALGTQFTPPATIDDTGIFDDLGDNATPANLTFLAGLGALLAFAILAVRRLRAAI